MISSILRRNWLTPLVGAFFLALGLSGVLMFFHVEFAAMHAMHEWIGLAFVIAAVLHLLLNWRSFVTLCKTRAAMFALTAAAVLCAGFLFGGPRHGGHDGHGQHGPGEGRH